MRLPRRGGTALIAGTAAPSGDHPAAGNRGPLLIFGAAFFWGTSATLARLVFRDRHVPPLTVVELRLLLAALLLGGWLVAKRRDALRVAPRDWRHFVILGVFGLAAVQGSYYYSISVLGVGLSILIQYLAPSLIVALDLVRGARVGRATAGAVLLALAGTAMLVGNLDPVSARATPLQWAIGFSTAPFFAFFIIYSKRRLARYPPETTLFYTVCIAGTLWALVTPPWKVLRAGYGPDLWLLFLALAVFSTLVPFSLFYAGLKRLPATRVSLIANLEPVIAVASAALVLGETLRPLQNVGALLVLVASVLSARVESHVSRAQEARKG